MYERVAVDKIEYHRVTDPKANRVNQIVHSLFFGEPDIYTEF